MAYLELSKGLRAVVDDGEYGRLARWRWHVASKGRYHVAVRYFHVGEKYTTRRLAHEVMGLGWPLAKGWCVDHINGDPLDCRRENLRLCTVAENNRNRGAVRGKRNTRYKGVYYEWRIRRWVAKIGAGGKTYHLGSYKNEFAAVVAYNLGALEHHGRFGRLNDWVGFSRYTGPEGRGPLVSSYSARAEEYLRNYGVPQNRRNFTEGREERKEELFNRRCTRLR